MLILTRKPGESLYIGDSVKVTIVEIKGNQIRVGIDAPSELRIYREEIYLQILDENRKAAEGVMSGSALDELTGSWKGVAQGPQQSRLPRAQKMTPAPRPQSTDPKVFVKRKKGRADEEEGEGRDSGSDDTEENS
jgi:carbon storage regulator